MYKIFFFFTGVQLYLAHNSKFDHLKLIHGSNIVPPVLIDSSANVSKSGKIGPNVIIGPNVTIEDGIRIQNATILADTTICTHSFIDSSIIGRKCSIGKTSKFFQFFKKSSFFRSLGPNRK